MKINISKTFGQFAVSASCEANEAQVAKLIELGALYIFERQPSSAVEQKVFGPMLGWDRTERGTYKRPAKFERGSVDYTDAIATDIKSTYEATKGKLGDGLEISFAVSNVVKHEAGSELAPTKEAIALWTEVQKLGNTEFANVLKAWGMSEDDYDDDRGIAACRTHIRKVKEEAKASMLAKLPKIG